MTLYVHFAAFLGAISLQLELTSAVTFVDLFIAESATGLMPTIEASVITVIPSLSETHYSISCRLDPQREKDPPCNLIDGATVTMNPSGMALERSWESSLLGLTAPEGRTTWDMTAAEYTTATCNIYGTGSASCTGLITSNATTSTYRVEGSTTTYLGTGQIAHSTSTISSQLGVSDMGGHMIILTVTGGLSHLQTTSTSTGGVAPRATGIGHGQAMVAGAVALAGGVALI